MTYGTQSANTGDDICELFSSFFKSSFLHPDPTGLSTSIVNHSNQYSGNTVGLGSIEISFDNLERNLKSLNINKSAGPDEIPPVFIVKCSRSLTLPLGVIFTRSITEGVVPSLWKSALVSPIHKKGSKSNVINYRPISKLCIFAKILEKIVYQQTYAAIKSSLIPQQHGFIRGRSTTSNLILTNDFIIDQMASGSQVDGIFTDFSKAFDRLDHNILLSKLQAMGIHGDLFRWYTSYIERRTQAVVLNGFRSTCIEIPSGIPQGSQLAPLLFVIFINDINSCFIHSEFYLFADDMKVLKPITSPIDCINLQADLDRFSDYCSLNKLDLNVDKCFVVTFSRKLTNVYFNYAMKNKIIARIDTIRDLGIMQDSKLTYVQHIDVIVNKALKALGFIMRVSTPFNNIKTLKILYCAYVRSILEYCSQVWSPHFECHIKRIERIQMKFLKLLEHRSRCYYDGYEERCKRHHFLPLQTRRKIADITYYLKVLSSQVDSAELLGKICLRTPTFNSRHTPVLAVPPAKTKYKQNTFFCRTPAMINEFLKCNKEIDIFTGSLRSIGHALSSDFFSL